MDPQIINVLLAGAIFILLVWNVALSVSLRRQSKRKVKLSKWLKGDQDVEEIFSKSLSDIASLTAKSERLENTVREHRHLLSQTVRHVGLTRYDAFDDLGGKMSFSAALLDENANGLVLTCINGRQDSRIYAKAVTEGKSAHQLSEEEAQAIKIAGQPQNGVTV